MASPSFTDGRGGARLLQNLVCVLPVQERQAVVPRGTQGPTVKRARGTRRSRPHRSDRLAASITRLAAIFILGWCRTAACGTVEKVPLGGWTSPAGVHM